MNTAVWHRWALATLVAVASAAAQGQAGSLSGSVDRNNARSSSSGITFGGDEGYWADEHLDPAYVFEDGYIQRRYVQRPRSHDPRVDPRNVGRRLPPGLGLGIGSGIGADVNLNSGIGAGIGSDTRALRDTAPLRPGWQVVPGEPNRPPRPQRPHRDPRDPRDPQLTTEW